MSCVLRNMAVVEDETITCIVHSVYAQSISIPTSGEQTDWNTSEFACELIYNTYLQLKRKQVLSFNPAQPSEKTLHSIHVLFLKIAQMGVYKEGQVGKVGQWFSVNINYYEASMWKPPILRITAFYFQGLTTT